MTFQPLPDVQLIGIVGAPRHGKDMLAKAIARRWLGAERFAFSDGIAAYARATGQMSARDPAVLQTAGWVLKQADNDIWLKVVYGSMQDRLPSLAIITGVRMLIEADMIREMGGSLVRVVRVDDHGAEFEATDRDMDHAVEQESCQIHCDREVALRTGRVDQMSDAADWIVEWLHGRAA